MPTLEKDDAGRGDGAQAGGHLRQAASAAAYGPGGGKGGPVRRFWSVRGLPAGIVALLVLAAAVLLLGDLVSVRAGESAMAWRRTLADQLATTRVDDAKVLAGACVAGLLGLWLILLALTPGLRGLLPMRRDIAHVRAGLHRGAAGLVLRDRAMEVPGVHSARVAVGRRKVRAKARAHFRDLHEVRGDLDTVLGEGIRQLGLARRLGLSVQVRRPKKR
ncbi:MAG: DUF6286 domain-containing protein [Streptomyces sp.]|uniref:DUF6286 domain-containing protein n=1 Tax=Streptomyces sp. TaxID=1931 RepID=UPI003D6A29DD